MCGGQRQVQTWNQGAAAARRMTAVRAALGCQPSEGYTPSALCAGTCRARSKHIRQLEDKVIQKIKDKVNVEGEGEGQGEGKGEDKVKEPPCPARYSIMP